MGSFRMLCVAGLFFLSCSSSKTGVQKETAQWVNLFNGKDLTGWKPKIAGYPLGENFGNTFRVDSGILSTRYDQYGNFNDRFGAIYYMKKFKNFRLAVDYRFTGELTAGAPTWGFRDGGINYLGQDPATLELNQPFPACLEYNLLGGNGKDDRATGEICAAGISIEFNGKKNTLFCTPPNVKRTFHGDQWVTAEIEVRDGNIAHFVNGEKILAFNKPQWDTTNATVKKMFKAGDLVIVDGYISLQSNSHPMDFKNIRIMAYK